MRAGGQRGRNQDPNEKDQADLEVADRDEVGRPGLALESRGFGVLLAAVAAEAWRRRSTRPRLADRRTTHAADAHLDARNDQIACVARPPPPR